MQRNRETPFSRLWEINISLAFSVGKMHAVYIGVRVDVHGPKPLSFYRWIVFWNWG